MNNRQSKRLSGPQIKLFLAILLRNKVVFDQFQVKLTVDHFQEEHYRILYHVLVDFIAEYERLPTETELTTEIESFLETEYSDISDETLDDLETFLDYVFSPDTFKTYPPTDVKAEKYAFRIGQRILFQHHKQDMQDKLATQDEDMMAVFLDAAFKSYSDISLTGYSNDKSLTFTEDWDVTDPLEFTTTGLGFLDKYLSGGTVPGEVYGLMAPYGTYKTTIGVMLWCLAAKQAYHESLIDPDNERKGLSVFVSYEAPLSPELRHRAVMYGAQIHRESMNSMGKEGLASLSNDPNAPLPYEQQLFKQQIADNVFIPERQRVLAVIPWMNEHTLCLDFSGADTRYPNAGFGGLSEIIQRIKLELRNRGSNYYVRNVFIDYLSIMVDRDEARKGVKKLDEDHKAYQVAVNDIGRRLAKPLKCPVWVFQQLSGTANAVLNVNKLPHHTDGKGSKSVAENMDFAFVGSNLTMDSMGRLACTKQRRAKRMPPTVIKVEGEYNLVCSPDNFYLDSKGNIVDKSIMATAGATMATNDFTDIQDVSEGIFEDL